MLAMLLISTSCKYDPVSYAKKSINNILKTFSKGAIEANDAMVILDNDLAFQKKLEIIKAAKSVLRLSYYIFSNDHSSAYLTEELIKAATERNVKVKLLVDMHSSYKNLDHFSMLMQKGQGNIEVRFYGRPGSTVMKDAFFLTTACKKGISKNKCGKKKIASIDKYFKAHDTTKEARLNISNNNNGLSGLFLSGLYAKDAEIMTSAVLTGQQLDITKLKGSSEDPMTDKEKNGLKEFAKIWWQSKTANASFTGLYDRLKLKFALLKYYDELNPIYAALNNHLPAGGKNRKQAKKEWTHLTDFAHHKLIMADDKVMQLGGRNVENSYHMKPNSLVDKYLFMDTDVFTRIKKNGKVITDTFDKLYNYQSLVATMQEVRTFAPNDQQVNKLLAAKFCSSINKEKMLKEYEKCLSKQKERHLKERMADAFREMSKNAATYAAAYNPGKNHPLIEDHVSNSGLGGYFKIADGAKLHYLENVPYTLNKSGRPSSRIFGTELNNKSIKSKGIHGVWSYEFLKSCETSRKENRNINIMVNNAYFFPSAELLYTFGRMIDGTFDCSKVTVNIISNSAKTTDLGPVNLLAQMSMKAFFTAVNYPEVSQFNAGKVATFKLFEYKELSANKSGKAGSLHTKAVAFDKSLFIGSANKDTRSIVMDTNNGFYITGDEKLVADYKSLLNKSIKSGLIYEVADNSVAKNLYQVAPSNMIIDQGWSEIYNKYIKNRNMKQKEIDSIKKKYIAIMRAVESNTKKIIYGKERTVDDGILDKQIGVTADREAMSYFNLITKEL